MALVGLALGLGLLMGTPHLAGGSEREAFRGGGQYSLLEEASVPRFHWLGMDMGKVNFAVRERGERWSLGLGKDLGTESDKPWFLGAGVSFYRNEMAAVEDSRKMYLRPWLGGCVSCDVGGAMRVGLELQYAPPGMADVGMELQNEGRAAVTFGFEW